MGLTHKHFRSKQVTPNRSRAWSSKSPQPGSSPLSPVVPERVLVVALQLVR